MVITSCAEPIFFFWGGGKFQRIIILNLDTGSYYMQLTSCLEIVYNLYRAVIILDIRERLQKCMERQGLTVYALARRSGLSWNAVDGMLKRKSNPTLQTLEKLCSGLGITPAQLLDDGGELPISAEQMNHINRRQALNERDRRIVDSMIDAMLNKK